MHGAARLATMPASCRVQLYGERLSCSQQRLKALKARLERARSERKSWTQKQWKRRAREIQASNIWGAHFHGGDRRSGTFRLKNTVKARHKVASHGAGGGAGGRVRGGDVAAASAASGASGTVEPVTTDTEAQAKDLGLRFLPSDVSSADEGTVLEPQRVDTLLNRLVFHRRCLEDLLEKVISPLLLSGERSGRRTSRKLNRLRAVAGKFDFDDARILAAVAALSKTPSARTHFENTSIDLLVRDCEQRIAHLEDKIAER